MLGLALGFILLFQGATPARPGAVSGQLRTLQGTPAISFRVAAIPAPSETSRPSFGSQYFYSQPPVSTALTDNQGRYRLLNVPPGRYFIVSGVTYFPSTLDADAASIVTVAPGASLDNTDFKLMRSFGGKVSGRVNPKPDPKEQTKAILSGVELQEILEVPVAADGSFEFGHVPTGAYLIDLVPPPPGMGAFRVQVGENDAVGLNLVPPPSHAVSGRIVVENGPLPRALLEFTTPRSLVSGTINADGTFNARLHSARHQVELAGMPVGWSVLSVKAGAQDASQGLVVGNADISGLVITVAAPKQLPHVRGQITGLADARLSSTKVEITGPINGSLQTAVQPNGSFDFAAVTPGLYKLRLLQVPELTPMTVVVTWNDANVQVAVPNR